MSLFQEGDVCEYVYVGLVGMWSMRVRLAGGVGRGEGGDCRLRRGGGGGRGTNRSAGLKSTTCYLLLSFS